MEQDGTWGDHVILYATANCYKTYIHVISSQSNHSDLTIRPDGHVISTNPLVLGHVHEVHYVSLQPKQGEASYNTLCYKSICWYGMSFDIIQGKAQYITLCTFSLFVMYSISYIPQGYVRKE